MGGEMGREMNGCRIKCISVGEEEERDGRSDGGRETGMGGDGNRNSTKNSPISTSDKLNTTTNTLILNLNLISTLFQLRSTATQP